MLSDADKDILGRVVGSKDFGEAVMLIPDEWDFFVSTTPEYPERCHATLVPTSLGPNHILTEHAEMGRAFGRGPTRHAALVRACQFVLRRAAGKPDITMLNLGQSAPSGRPWP